MPHGADAFLSDESSFGQQASQLLQVLTDNKVTHLYFAGMNSERSVQVVQARGAMADGGGGGLGG